MTIFQFPADFVYWNKIENHEEIKKELLPIILEKNDKIKNNPFDACNFNTSHYNNEKLHNENEFLKDHKLLNHLINKNILKMYKESVDMGGFMPNIGDSFVQSSWWNVYNERDHQELHEHNGPPFFANDKYHYPSLSIIYILHDENEKSSLLFKKRSSLPLMKPCDNFIFDTSNVETIGEGSIIIFPCGLSHLVKPCIKPGRVTIAYNLYSTFQY